MSVLIYGFTSLDTVDGNSLKELDGADLNDGDLAFGLFVVTSGVNAFGAYKLDADSAITESLPGVVAPTTNAGDKRWILQSFAPATSASNNDKVLESGANAGTYEWVNQWLKQQVFT